MDESGSFDDADLPMDDLRRAWQGLEAPRPDVELAEEDPRTRAAVEWMQQAWRRVEAPTPIRRLVPRPQPTRRWLVPLAAAAGVLLALATWQVLQRLDGGARPWGVDTEIAGTSPAQPALPESPAPGRIDGDVELAALAPDRVELRSGPVRLILLTGDPSPRTQEN